MKNSVYGKPVFGYKGTKWLLYAVIFTGLFSSCSVSKQISKQANSILLQDSIIGAGHVGISIYEPATGTYLYNCNASKYFIPASNTKLFTLYAGMKYLGDSLVGLRYTSKGDSTIIFPTGDPTFLHSDFKKNPVLIFLKSRRNIFLSEKFFYRNAFGKGWVLDDFKESYMTQRSAFPLYGNRVKFSWFNSDSIEIYPGYFKKTSGVLEKMRNGFETVKKVDDNHFIFINGNDKTREIPFRTDPITIKALLTDTLKVVIENDYNELRNNENMNQAIHSQPTDSLLKPMMHNSDNFFAEQTLLMASNEHLGYMDDEAIIDTLLKSDFKDIPQQPRWVDGSGLSRYNLFTPQSLVYILNKLKNEFGLERLKVILPTGGEGTLKNYYNADSGFIYAKTGSMSNQFTLCGYLTTKKNRLLLFSILINNEMGSAADVRRAVERFVKSIRNTY